ncbi:hypothetical protein Asppvi_003799 [Aspergillus pseudoviridinutans]|uniref:Uncharacterized protein n=1 Tax=Aspergillus pseudoviridinutans TaxID=1517512 RepID=A0A9P3BBI3_9EURO|nr:uncharacterized protein Asppvi_003799 [Aspergillus pseudoviridinutans]GIJ84944.1 hypothetical protein Asppvi_003799 [Aspergillus pseudoviridinutans]
MATELFPRSVIASTTAFASSPIPGPSMTVEHNAATPPSPRITGVTQTTAVYSQSEVSASTTLAVYAQTSSRSSSLESPFTRIPFVQVPISSSTDYVTSAPPTALQSRSEIVTNETLVATRDASVTALGNRPSSITDTLSDESALQSLGRTSFVSQISLNGEMSVTTSLPSANYPSSASSAPATLVGNMPSLGQSSLVTETSNMIDKAVIQTPQFESSPRAKSRHATTSDMGSNSRDALSIDTATLSAPAEIKLDMTRDVSELPKSLSLSSRTVGASAQGISEQSVTTSAPRYDVSRSGVGENSTGTQSQELDDTADSGSSKSGSSGQRSSTTTLASPNGELGVTMSLPRTYHLSSVSSAPGTLNSNVSSLEQPSLSSESPSSNAEPIIFTTEIAHESPSLVNSQQPTTSELVSSRVTAPTGNASADTSVESNLSKISDGFELKSPSRSTTAVGSWSQGTSAPSVTMGASSGNISELFGLGDPSTGIPSQEDGTKIGHTPKGTAMSGAIVSVTTGEKPSITKLGHWTTSFEHAVMTSIKQLAEQNGEEVSLLLTAGNQSSHLSQEGQLTSGNSTRSTNHSQNDRITSTPPPQPAEIEDPSGSVLAKSTSHSNVANLSILSLSMPVMLPYALTKSTPTLSDPAVATILITALSELTPVTMVHPVHSGSFRDALPSEHSHQTDVLSVTSTEVRNFESFTDASTSTARPTRDTDAVYQASQSHSVNKSSVFISVGVVSGALCIFLIVFGWARHWCKSEGMIRTARAETQKLTPRDPNRSYFSLYSEDGS